MSLSARRLVPCAGPWVWPKIRERGSPSRKRRAPAQFRLRLGGALPQSLPRPGAFAFAFLLATAHLSHRFDEVDDAKQDLAKLEDKVRPDQPSPSRQPTSAPSSKSKVAIELGKGAEGNDPKAGRKAAVELKATRVNCHAL